MRLPYSGRAPDDGGGLSRRPERAGAGPQEQLACEVTPELYRQIRRLWTRHSIAEDRRDLPGLLDTLTEDCVYEVVPTGQRWEGHGGARAFYESFLGAFPDVMFHLADIVIGPQGVMEVAELAGTQRGPWARVAPHGRPVRLVVIIHFPCAGAAGKVDGEKVYFDRAALAARYPIAWIPSPPFVGGVQMGTGHETPGKSRGLAFLETPTTPRTPCSRVSNGSQTQPPHQPCALLALVSPHPPRLPHLQLDDGRELPPRRVPDAPQHALDDDRRDHVEALVALAPRELDSARHAGRSRGLDAIAAVVFIDQRIRNEDEAAVSLVGCLGCQVGQPDSADGRGGRG